MAEPHSQKKPLLLRGRLRVLPESKPNPGTTYDPHRQLWLDSSGLPVVSQHPNSSDFGETSRTDSHEGVAQSEISIVASDFGETTVTKTSEGHDATEVAYGSDFGETSMTRTTEGVDVSERSEIAQLPMMSDFGETTKTAIHEGSDQTDVS